MYPDIMDQKLILVDLVDTLPGPGSSGSVIWISWYFHLNQDYHINYF